jgi:4-amino-4-deoxy-L-arabinose transferase-like glycosyltransferase
MSVPRRLVLAAILVSAAHFMFLVVVAPVPLGADALEYDKLGRGIAGGLGYTLGEEPVTSLMPGYPVFLGALYFCFGPHPTVIRVVQVLCITMAACVLWTAMRRHWGERAAWIGFWAIALLPAWFIYPGTLNAESVLLMVEITFLAASLRQPKTLIWAAGCGAICGVLVLIKPEFVVWLPLPALLVGRRRVPVTFAVTALCLAVVLAPWTIRNALAFNRFIPLSTKTGHALWLSGHRPELTEFGGAEFNAALARCHVPGDPKATDGCLLSDAKSQVAEHPGYFVKTAVGRVVHTLFGSNTEYLRGFGGSFAEARRMGEYGVLGIKGALLVLHTTFVLGGLLGIAWLCRERRYWFLLYLLGSKLAVHAVLFGTARYGLHLSPLFAIGWGALGTRVQHDGNPKPIG